MKIQVLATAVALAFAATAAQAAPNYFEDFEAPFPAWESGWLGTNSNLQNYYGVGHDRGNNPDGLWLSSASIRFNSAFGATIGSLSFDVASWGSGTIAFYDSANNLLSNQTLTANYGALSNPGTYQHFSVVSQNGISHVDFNTGNYAVPGNTSIDNVAVTAVPEPEAYALMLAGLGLLGVVARRRKQNSFA